MPHHPHSDHGDDDDGDGAGSHEDDLLTVQPLITIWTMVMLMRMVIIMIGSPSVQTMIAQMMISWIHGQ